MPRPRTAPVLLLRLLFSALRRPSSQFQATRTIPTEAGVSGVMTAGEKGKASGGVSGGREDEEQDGEWRRKRLEPLWDGLGSLKDRLAGVGDLFDELEHDINHDRQASIKALRGKTQAARCAQFDDVISRQRWTWRETGNFHMCLLQKDRS